MAQAESDGLLTIGDRVTFRHPMVRSTVYRGAPPEERRAAHRALADATDRAADPDRRAWHSALATIEADEEVALDLERSADRARARGGRAAEAAFLRRSAALTVDPARRAERALAAAQATIQAGDFDSGLGLLAAAEAGPLGGLERARAELMRGQIAFASSRGSDAAALLLKAARRFEVLDARLASDTYLEALGAAIFASRLAVGGGMQEVADAVLTAPAPQQPQLASDLLLDGLATLISTGYRAGVPILKKAVSAFRGTDLPVDEGLRWLWLACHAAGIIWDYDSWDVLSARQIKLARDTGAIVALPIAFNTRAGVDLLAGDFVAADAMVAEARVVGEVTQSSIVPYGSVALAVFRGNEADAVRQIEAATEDIRRRGEGEGLSFVHWATAVLFNGQGRYEQALSAAQQAQDDDSPALWFANWAAVELVEAASRVGRPDQAADAVRRVSETTQAAGTDWALGVEARSRALVSHGDAAESRYLEAVDRLDRSGLRLELGRADLVYGEWLRRQRRRRDARDHLARAYGIFTRSGAMAFAGRARIELRACGGLVHDEPVDTRDPLTAQEALIARLAGAGSSNPDIAAQLFISRATVAYHLRKIFTKLRISSRNELAQALSDERR